MRRNALLEIDGAGNLLLGGFFLLFPRPLVEFLGLPAAESTVYPSLFGALLVGIGVALLLQRFRGQGLGLAGAVSINLCFGAALLIWLAAGELSMPLRGHLLLWVLAVVLFAISAVELVALRRA